MTFSRPSFHKQGTCFIFICMIDVSLSDASFTLSFLVPCLNTQTFSGIQNDFIQALSTNLGIDQSILSIQSRRDPTAVNPGRRLLSIPAPLPGVSITLQISSVYDQDVALLRDQLDEPALSAALRSIGAPCVAYIQGAPSILMRTVPPAVVALADQSFELSDPAGLQTNGRVLADGPAGATEAAVWFRIEPSAGNVSGGAAVTVGVFVLWTALAHDLGRGGTASLLLGAVVGALVGLWIWKADL